MSNSTSKMDEDIKTEDEKKSQSEPERPQVIQVIDSDIEQEESVNQEPSQKNKNSQIENEHESATEQAPSKKSEEENHPAHEEHPPVDKNFKHMDTDEEIEADLKRNSDLNLQNPLQTQDSKPEMLANPADLRAQDNPESSEYDPEQSGKLPSEAKSMIR